MEQSGESEGVSIQPVSSSDVSSQPSSGKAMSDGQRSDSRLKPFEFGRIVQSSRSPPQHQPFQVGHINGAMHWGPPRYFGSIYTSVLVLGFIVVFRYDLLKWLCISRSQSITNCFVIFRPNRGFCMIKSDETPVVQDHIWRLFIKKLEVDPEVT